MTISEASTHWFQILPLFCLGEPRQLFNALNEQFMFLSHCKSNSLHTFPSSIFPIILWFQFSSPLMWHHRLGMAHMVWICCISSFSASSSRNLHLCRCYALFLRQVILACWTSQFTFSSALLVAALITRNWPKRRPFFFRSLENAQLSDREVTYQKAAIRLVEELSPKLPTHYWLPATGHPVEVKILSSTFRTVQFVKIFIISNQSLSLLLGIACEQSRYYLMIKGGHITLIFALVSRGC
jgi:hypothetical protein